MKKEKDTQLSEKTFPSSKQIERELDRIKNDFSSRSAFKSAVFIIIVTAAIIIILNSMFFPVMRIYGTSMNPTLNDSDIVFALKTGKLKRGDICCFYNNNSLLCKRVIGLAGEEISIDENGSVYINNQLYPETYISQQALGECDITFPYKVPEQSYFVMGDNRPVSEDSRSSKIGCVSQDQIVCKLLFKVWPVGLID